MSVASMSTPIVAHTPVDRAGLLPKISIGAYYREKIDAAVLDLEPVNETAGFQQSGILGANFLRFYRIVFDFDKGVVRLELTVNEDGDVGVTYYDIRTLKPGNTTTLPTSTWLTVSPRGGERFGRERRIAPAFDFLQGPRARSP